MRRAIIVLVLVVGATLIPTAAHAEGFRSDSASYNGSVSALGFSTFGNARLYTLYDTHAVLQLPAHYANGYCAYARIGVNGVAKAQTYIDCDTNGDARLEFSFSKMYASRGDYVDVWFSDPVTRYRITHPSIRL